VIAPTLAGMAAAGAVCAAAVAVTAAGADGLVLTPVVAAQEPSAAARRPPRVRRRAARRRAHAVDAAVPQLLDLLAAGSSAGLSAELAVRRGAEALAGPLGEDLRALFARADIGARWRDELAAYVERSGSSDLRRAVAVLERTEALGSSLVDATAELAVAVRQARRAAVLERARTAPVKMLFPLVFLILPAFLLLTVVPVLLTTLRSIA
jgi:tight adherence protein C